MHYLAKISTTKRKNYTTINKYILKFDSLVQARKQAQKQTTADTDEFYIKIFVKNSSPADMRRFLKEKAPTKLTEAYKCARSFEDEDSSDEDTSGTSSSEDEFSDSSVSSGEVKKHKRKTKVKSSAIRSAPPKVNSKEPSFKAALLTMLEQQQQQLLLMQQQQTTPTLVSNTNKRCYNCKVVGHFDDQCPDSCKHCGSRDHRRYQCPNKPASRAAVSASTETRGTSNHANVFTGSNPTTLFMALNKAPPQSALLATEQMDALAIKRIREAGSSKAPVKKQKKESEASTSTNNPDHTTLPVAAIDKQPTTVPPATEVAPSQQPLEVDAEMQGPPKPSTQPKEFYEVIPDPLRVNSRATHATKVATVVSELRKQKVFTLSYDELIALSSKAHTDFRRTLASQQKLNLEQPVDYSGVLLNTMDQEHT
ncbi:hypothetical protein [Parasitella parasitica]|uniref:CCHC-type domain-containing protein n=1 Tax=Parasitella parasitica TaxID=35722 RepID=A0A0B7MU99_9FUNG|nr:hypothetical protein [Parasitella parasitica]